MADKENQQNCTILLFGNFMVQKHNGGKISKFMIGLADIKIRAGLLDAFSEVQRFLSSTYESLGGGGHLTNSSPAVSFYQSNLPSGSRG